MNCSMKFQSCNYETMGDVIFLSFIKIQCLSQKFMAAHKKMLSCISVLVYTVELIYRELVLRVSL